MTTTMRKTKKRFYGKYRGTVITPIDPEMKGKVQALVTLGGTPVNVWAEACTPYAGPGVGFFAIPPSGAGVWIEFEEGDPDKPIWTGCWWGEGDVLALLALDIPPPTPASAATTVLLGAGLARLRLDTLTGTAVLESLAPPGTPATPTQVKLGPGMIEIDLGPQQILITPANILINRGALTVLP